MVGLHVPTRCSNSVNGTIYRSMDFVHTVMVCIANWLYLVEHFGDRSGTDEINWYKSRQRFVLSPSPMLL